MFDPPPAHTPLPLWSVDGITVILEDSTLACDRCGFPFGNVANTFGMLWDGTRRHAQQHAQPRTAPPGYLGDTPTPAGGWFNTPPRWDAPDAYLVIDGGKTHVFDDAQTAVMVASSLITGGRVIGPVHVFANFDTAPEQVRADAVGTLRLLARTDDDATAGILAGPVTTAELAPPHITGCGCPQCNKPGPHETTHAHPDTPDGPWQHFEDCLECGAHRGYPCDDITDGTSPGRPLGHAHTTRVLDRAVSGL